MADSTFLYVTYIRTTPEALWEALTTPEFISQYWGVRAEAEWRLGGPWKIYFKDGRLADSGEIVEFEPPRRLAIKWRNEFKPEITAEGFSHCLFELEPMGANMKLTVTHSVPVEDSKFVKAVSSGWPAVLSSLKSLLETGQVLGLGV